MLIKDANGIPVVVDSLPADPEVAYQKIKAETAPAGVVNAQITWGQFLGGLMSDYLNPAVVVPTLMAILTALQVPNETWKAGIVVVLGAYITALQLVMHFTGTTGLMMRLRSMGQINGGR